MPEIITKSDAQYAYDLVEAICTAVGPGLPGSSQERERAGMIKQELASCLGAENVGMEEFAVAPGALVGSLPISGLLMLLAALLNLSLGRFTGIPAYVWATAALILSILALLLVILEFILSFELLDPFFSQKQSINVIGKLRKPGAGNVKRVLILSGHHDSAQENTWLRWLGYGFFFAFTAWFIGLVTMLAMSVIQLAGIITGNAGLVRLGTLGWILLAFPIVPAIIFAVFFTREWKGAGSVPGAVDNLAASALAVALCRFLVRNADYIPADTEIRFISFGSEEAGLRGSRRYVERHLNELKGLDARLLNFEMVAHPEIVILTSDVNGSVKHSPAMVAEVAAAASRAGVPYEVKPASFGVGTDAAPFSRAGLQATTLLPFKTPEQLVAFYHQRTDRPEALSLEPLLNVLKLTLVWITNGREGETTPLAEWRASDE